MADKKDAPAPTKTHPATPVFVPLFILMLVGAIYFGVETFIAAHPALQDFLHLLGLFLTGKATLGQLASQTTVPLYRFLIYLFLLLSLLLSAILLWLIISTRNKLKKVHATMHAPLIPPTAAAIAAGAAGAAPTVSDMNPKWLKVLGHIHSDSASDWKLAILEADIMLDEMLDKAGYPGQTISEKLKLVDKNSFSTLDMAWEAHKVRNSIAHEGSDFALSKDEASRVVTMFERVFKEFKYI